MQHTSHQALGWPQTLLLLLISLLTSPFPADAQMTLDNNGNTGAHSAVAVGQDGLPVIAYEGDPGLRVIKCGDASCTTFTTYDHSAIAFSATEISLAIRTDGRPLIAYSSLGSLALELFDCSDVPCSSGSSRRIDNARGRYSSMLIRSDGRPMVAYNRATGDRAIRVFDCADLDCSDGAIRTLDVSMQGNSLGSFPDIAETDGLPLVSYIDDFPNSRLKVFRCADVNCASGTIYDVGGGASSDTQIVVPADERPLITYYTGNALRLLDCLDTDCSQVDSRTLDDGFSGSDAAMTLNGSGNAVISYYDGEAQALKTYACDDSRCRSGKADEIDSNGNVGQFTSIALRPADAPIISYFDQDNTALKVFDCVEERCAITIFNNDFE